MGLSVDISQTFGIDSMSVRRKQLVIYCKCEQIVHFSHFDEWRSMAIATGVKKKTDYLSNRPHFLSVYRRNNPLGMMGEHEKSL